MAGQDLFPDGVILQPIFDETVQDCRISIILQTWDKCVFKVAPAALPAGRYKLPVIVRLESASASLAPQFALTAEIQKLASESLPGLVPSVLQLGKVHNSTGREYCFSVVEFVDGVTLETVWADLREENKRLVVNDIAEALTELQKRKLEDEAIQGVLAQAADGQKDDLLSKPLYFGGAHTMALTTGSSLLDAVMERRKLKREFCDIEKEENSMRVTVKSRFGDLGSVTIEKRELDQWKEQAVLCHNDLTPRNLLLKKTSNDTAESLVEYRLAAIIDWELGGMYPSAYEMQLQDTYLGGGNRHVSFYLMLKEAMQSIVPCNRAQQDLLRAVELIFESQQRFLFEGSNIPAQIRVRFLQYCNLTRDQNIYRGWTNQVENSPTYDADIIQKIEDDVIAEVMAKRAAKKQSESSREQ
ncbi:Protein kinase-like domain [Cordyceps militaris CM01]|uniref:Protein kinase-like domain n=1 Tax=Cordyceps militaris (strain CM01) TaxID=983644 RepID=G3JJC2_CORMM|nr:Protein kinase-like domain [Cordyceps militaris CM01]EGX91216.1 Protein kinase-like domain [Cordyceps militaris CM01]